MDFFRHFSEEGHHRFLEDIRVKVIDRLFGRDRVCERFWQHKLGTFTPRGHNVREVELKYYNFIELSSAALHLHILLFITSILFYADGVDFHILFF